MLKNLFLNTEIELYCATTGFFKYNTSVGEFIYHRLEESAVLSDEQYATLERFKTLYDNKNNSPLAEHNCFLLARQIFREFDVDAWNVCIKQSA